MEEENTNSSIKKHVRIHFNKFKYEGILLYEDNIIYRIKDDIEGIINIPKANSIMKETQVKKEADIKC